jgi:hypothetical protein
MEVDVKLRGGIICKNTLSPHFPVFNQSAASSSGICRGSSPWVETTVDDAATTSPGEPGAFTILIPDGSEQGYRGLRI